MQLIAIIPRSVCAVSEVGERGGTRENAAGKYPAVADGEDHSEHAPDAVIQKNFGAFGERSCAG